MESPHEHNRAAWDDRARKRMAHTETAGDAQFTDPWTFIDDCGWLGRNVAGKNVLCLAAGGGWHGPLFASVGARVTVVDIFAFKPISFWQAWGLILLSQILFKANIRPTTRTGRWRRRDSVCAESPETKPQQPQST